MIRPILSLEYASDIWSPHTQKNIDLLEAVQRQSVRFIFNNYLPYASVSEMLNLVLRLSQKEEMNQN